MTAIKCRFISSAIFIAIIATIITQLPFFLEQGFNSIGIFVWIPVLLYLILKKAFKRCSIISFPIVCFIIYSFLLFLFNIFVYIYPIFSCFRNFAISISMLIIGYFLANVLNEKQFVKSVVYAAMIGGVIYAIVLNNTIFYIVDLDSVTYAYGAKNSASKILFSCMIIVLFLYTPKFKLLIFMKCIIILFYIYIILIMKSRATILSLIIPVIAVVFYSKNRNMRKYTCIFLFVLILLCLCFPSYPELFFNKIILNNKIDADLDTVSSGRIWMIKKFFIIFNDYAFVGGSDTFVENFYLITLLEVGFIGATPVFLFLLWFCIVLKKYFNFTNPVDICCLILLMAYYIDGLFEAMAPFGPGAKCFFLWLVLGFFVNKRMLINNKLFS